MRNVILKRSLARLTGKRSDLYACVFNLEWNLVFDDMPLELRYLKIELSSLKAIRILGYNSFTYVSAARCELLRHHVRKRSLNLGERSL